MCGLGGSVIFVQVDPPAAPALSLYQKFGVAERVVHFDLPL